MGPGNAYWISVFNPGVVLFRAFNVAEFVQSLGICVLELSVDPAVFAELPRVQQRLFRTTDVLMTGVVLGGGSDALHQLMLVFTNFFQSAAGRAKGGSASTSAT